jgi:hypothetical protein
LSIDLSSDRSPEARLAQATRIRLGLAPRTRGEASTMLKVFLLDDHEVVRVGIRDHGGRFGLRAEAGPR